MKQKYLLEGGDPKRRLFKSIEVFYTLTDLTVISQGQEGARQEGTTVGGCKGGRVQDQERTVWDGARVGGHEDGRVQGQKGARVGWCKGLCPFTCSASCLHTLVLSHPCAK